MNRKFTAEQIDKLREVDRMRKRATMSAWLNAGIHINDEHQAASAKPADPAPDKYAEVNRMKLRNEYLSWIFGGVHIDNFHEDWDRMSPAAKDALRGEVSGGQQLSDEQMERFLRAFTAKWCYVTTADGRESVRVMENNFWAHNYISHAQIERLGLKAQRCLKVTHKMPTGEEFSPEGYVELAWEGKGSRQGKGRFFIAPEEVRIEMLVGKEFIEQHGGALMEEDPTTKRLTLQ